MKYLSVVLFALLMIWTWSIVNSEPLISFETHAGIQSKMASLIIESVRNKRPKATDIEIEKIWTESPQNRQDQSLKAHFSYRFKEPAEDGGMVESVIKGYGLLHKQDDDGSGLEKWTLENVKTTSDVVIFDQALVISTGDTPATEPAAEEPSGAEPAH